METKVAQLSADNNELRLSFLESEITCAELGVKCAMYETGVELKEPVVVYKEPILPSSFICPVSMSLMKDPAIIKCGHTFEMKAINKVFKDSKTIGANCPVCKTLVTKEATRNIALRSAIDDYLHKSGEKGFFDELTQNCDTLIKTLHDAKNQHKSELKMKDAAHAAALKALEESHFKAMETKDNFIEDTLHTNSRLRDTVVERDRTIAELKAECKKLKLAFAGLENLASSLVNHATDAE